MLRLMRCGLANSCRQNPSGNLQLEVDWRARSFAGAATSLLTASTWRIHGKVNSRSRTRLTTVLNGQRQSDHFHQTVMDFMTWLATSGNGPPIGISNTAS